MLQRPKKICLLQPQWMALPSPLSMALQATKPERWSWRDLLEIATSNADVLLHRALLAKGVVTAGSNLMGSLGTLEEGAKRDDQGPP